MLHGAAGTLAQGPYLFSVIFCRKRNLKTKLRRFPAIMRVGCFTALLSQFPLDKVLEKLKGLGHQHC